MLAGRRLGQLTAPVNSRVASPVRGVRVPDGKREYNFFILVSVPPARGQLYKITGAQQTGTT